MRRIVGRDRRHRQVRRRPRLRGRHEFHHRARARRRAARAARDGGRDGPDLRPDLRRREAPPAQEGRAPDPARASSSTRPSARAAATARRQSNCLAVVPRRDRARAQARRSTSRPATRTTRCAEGFCPSFVTVEGGKLRSAAGVAPERLAPLVAALPSPAARAAADLRPAGHRRRRHRRGDRRRLIGMAAHLEGRPASVLDFIGLAQKGGAVLSLVRIAPPAGGPPGPRRPAARPTRCSPATWSSPRAATRWRRCAAGARGWWPTPSRCRPPNSVRDPRHLARRAAARSTGCGCGRRRMPWTRSTRSGWRSRPSATRSAPTCCCSATLGSRAWCRVSLRAIERAIELNGVAVEANRAAFTWGRLAAAMPERLADLRAPPPRTRRRATSRT